MLGFSFPKYEIKILSVFLFEEIADVKKIKQHEYMSTWETWSVNDKKNYLIFEQ